MDFGKLQNPGCNGMLLIIVSLTWWGALANDKEEWKRTVVDVNAVLCCLSSTIASPNGTRSNNADENNGSLDHTSKPRKAVSSLKRKALADSSVISTVVPKKARPVRTQPPRCSN